MRIASFVSSAYHSLASGLNRTSGLWLGHKVRVLPPQNTLPNRQPFSAKTLQQWQIFSIGTGEELLQLRNKRLRQRELDRFVGSLENHYSDFYDSKDQLRSKVAFVLTELGLAAGQRDSLKPSGFFASKLNDRKLFLLDRYLSCPDPVEFGRTWLNDGGTLDQGFVFHCVYPARAGDAPLYSNDELNQMGFIRRSSDDSYTLVSVGITHHHLEKMERVRKSRPVQSLVSEQKGLMTLKKLKSFCHSLAPFVGEPLQSELQKPLEEDNLHHLLELTIHPSIQYFKGLDQSIQRFVNALQSHQALEQQLAKAENTDPVQPVLMECLVALSSASLDENTQTILTGIFSDIQQQQLTEERLNHYIIALLVQAPEQARMLSHLFSLMARNLIDIAPDSAIQNTPWQHSFHKDFNLIVQQVERFNSMDRDLRKFYVTEIPSLLAQVTESSDDFSSDKGLSRLFGLIEEVHDACSLSSISSETRQMIKVPSEQWLNHITGDITKRLPVALKYALHEEESVSPEFLGVEKMMKKEWQSILDSINRSDEMLSQFEKDRPRTDFQLKVASGSRKRRKDQNFSHISHTLQTTQLMRFLGNRHAARTLSKLLTQTFAAYQTKLETYRLRQVTPFLLTPMGRDPNDSNLVTVTQLADGNLAVDYTMTASKPSYLLGARGAGIMGLKTYQISGRSIVSMESLKRGIVQATEPEVTVKLNTRDGQIDWYVDGNDQLEQIPCPYLPSEE
ncbi:hypothetical protein [Endozoicomonas numazuensis]|nr:hypothetical protein [Endozoicomonas numazuensis]